MQQLSYFELIGFGPNGWGLCSSHRDGNDARGRRSAGSSPARSSEPGRLGKTLAQHDRCAAFADGYTTVLRGIPDLLVIYLFYFGGSAALGAIGSLFGAGASSACRPSSTGALAIGIVSGAYQAEVFRGAYQIFNRGELEAARSVGMHRWLMFRRIIAPQVLRYAIPGLGNTGSSCSRNRR